MVVLVFFVYCVEVVGIEECGEVVVGVLVGVEVEFGKVEVGW